MSRILRTIAVMHPRPLEMDPWSLYETICLERQLSCGVYVHML